jgi:hypothetical protein
VSKSLASKRSRHLRRAIRATLNETERERAEQAGHALHAAGVSWSWFTVNELATTLGTSPLEVMLSIGRAASRRKKKWDHSSLSADYVDSRWGVRQLSIAYEKALAEQKEIAAKAEDGEHGQTRGLVDDQTQCGGG